MQRPSIFPLACTLVLTLASCAPSAEPKESFLRELPPGLVLTSSTEIPAKQSRAIGEKLGGKTERLTNSYLQVYGRPIQVNAFTAADEPSVKAIHAAVSKMKSCPSFCVRKDWLVIEYVGNDIDVALATKTSYELGLLEKPGSVRYRVVAELATVEKADYMACNPMFICFLALRGGPNEDAIRQINELRKGFKFGQRLVLRNPKLSSESAARRFQPPATAVDESVATVSYTFDQLADRHGVPYVTATMWMTVDDTGFREETATPAKSLTAATPFWPADDAKVTALARRITEGRTTNDGKAMAILEWLQPGKNLKYSGQTGSRWGVRKVLEQKFGHCWDFSDCFVTLCRATGVPSRQTAGWLYGSNGHVWAEFYREGKGWQQVDATGGGRIRCGIYYIPYFTSEDGEMPILYVSMPQIEVMPTK
jgi:hypothetical protein